MKLRELFQRTGFDSLINSYWAERFAVGLDNPTIGIDIIFGNGRRIRAATRAISLQKESGGASVAFEPLLQGDPVIDESYSWTGGSPSQRAFNVSIDARALNPIQVVLGGSILAGSAEVSLIDDGVPYEKRFVIMLGEMVGGVTFEQAESVISFDISDPKLTLDRIVPAHFATSETITTLPEDQEGLRYPLVLSSYASVPCIRLTGNKYGTEFMIAMGHDWKIDKAYRNGEEVYDTPQIFEQGTGVSHTGVPITILIPMDNPYQWELKQDYDANGVPFSKIDFAYSTILLNEEYTWKENDTVYCDISSTNSSSNLSVVRSVQDLIANYTGFGIDGCDQVLFNKAIAREPSFLKCGICINGSKDQTTTTLDYITGTLLASFPMVQLAYSSQGIGAVFTDRTRPYVEMSLVRGQGLLYDRVSAIEETSKEEIYNSFTLQYNYDAMNDTYRKTLSRDAKSNIFCSISESSMGTRERDPILSINIFDDQTASYVLDWLCNHHTLPSYTVSYEGSPELFFLLKIGDNIEITDEKIGLNNIKATVEAITYEKGKTTLGLRLWLLYEKTSAADE